MKNETCNFHGTKMTIQVLTDETDGMYSVMYFEHPPNVGPALHMHPRGPESFHILDGQYRFLIGDKTIDAKKGDTITVPKGVSHKFDSGKDGGQFLVISPPGLENYFYELSQLLSKGAVEWNVESEIARKYGQIFLESSNHWTSV